MLSEWKGRTSLSKYGHRAPPTIHLPDRRWPSRTTTTSPIWLSTDLRDGNQALPNPMTIEQKWQMFRLLVAIGFKQIEISFPVASATEYNFTRQLIECPNAVPDDVQLEVITPCRKDALKTAVDSLRGAKKAILFSYISSSDNYRDTILQISEGALLEHVRTCVEYARSITKDNSTNGDETEWSFGFGFEDFACARPEAALRLAETIITAWQPTKEYPLILGCASSIEISTPNVFADQVECFIRNLPERDKVCVSIHTHNDRGGAIASAELALLAGADRVEGCLFGNGERAGNCDLVTCAMNLYTHGIDTGLDFSQLPNIRRVCEDITNISVHPRAPYAGDYCLQAFSGAHQDAICKGLHKRAQDAKMGRDPAWCVPYLPLDPTDIGVPLDRIIGVNSQSGKGGVAWIIRQELGLNLPNDLTRQFGALVKDRCDILRRQLPAAEIATLFLHEYNLEVSCDAPTLDDCKDSYCPIGVGVCHLEDVTILAKKVAKALDTFPVFESDRLLALTHVLPNLLPDTRLEAAFARCEFCGTAPSQAIWGVGIGNTIEEALRRSLLSMIQVYPPTLCIAKNLFHFALST